MARDWRLRVKDIEQSIDRIATYIKGFDYETFSGDRRTVDAVIHNIQVIGEAAIALPDSITKRYPTVPWANIRAMRHILVHGYFAVDLEIVWFTAKHRPSRAAARVATSCKIAAATEEVIVR